MEKITVERDNQRNISFIGELLAKTSSSDDRAMGSSYSGETGRWQVLKLYKTEQGNFVCQRINRTCWQGERDSYEAVICRNELEIFDFFGYSRLAKDLYIKADVNNLEIIN